MLKAILNLIDSICIRSFYTIFTISLVFLAITLVCILVIFNIIIRRIFTKPKDQNFLQNIPKNI